MQAIVIALLLSAAPAYDVSSWDLSPESIPRINATGDTPEGVPVISGGGIVTDPAQVSGMITNMLAKSENIVSGTSAVSPWTIYTAGGASAPTLSTVASTIPSGGTATVARIQIPATTDAGQFSQIYQQYTGISASYAFSIWLKLASGTTGSCRVRIQDSTDKALADCDVTTQWQRCSAIGALNAGSQFFVIGNARAVLPASDVLAWGAQVEQVGGLSVPGPYVATGAASESGTRGEYEGQPSDPGILVPVQLSDPRTWGVGISASKASWAGADALVDIGGQLSGYRWNSARLETTAGGALVFTVIDATGASATRTVAAHEFADGSTHRLSFGAFDGIPFLLVDGVDSGTLAGAAVLSSFPSAIGINSTVHPMAKTVYRVSQGPTPWSAQTRLK